ncbi:hypothetical protein F9C07_9326 [Aspergillus flavus]|uniref:Uncharacterized protein n=1 Tax=Aspergillus flavus (strain ATCC 200026 / FGSC A1120 / IAM 13836 / NRRL 3357 / JCM 12722 / SRRC 167) TaxID=332952 RepID=A0A7U2MJV1_ASPFN|nr:hypothetical protein F9C07_9326 [Aspergillus flavus]
MKGEALLATWQELKRWKVEEVAKSRAERMSVLGFGIAFSSQATPVLMKPPGNMTS